MRGKQLATIVGASIALSVLVPGLAAASESHLGSKYCASNQLATIASNTSTLGPPVGSYTTEHQYNGAAQYYYSFGSWRSYSPTAGAVSWYIYTNHTFNSYDVGCTRGIG